MADAWEEVEHKYRGVTGNMTHIQRAGLLAALACAAAYLYHSSGKDSDK